jgi:hypothetical protein
METGTTWTRAGSTRWVEIGNPGQEIFLYSLRNNGDCSYACKWDLKPDLTQDFAFDSAELMQAATVGNGDHSAGWVGAESGEMDVASDVVDIRLVLIGKAHNLQAR